MQPADRTTGQMADRPEREQRPATILLHGEDDAVKSGRHDDALILRARKGREAPHLWRSTAVAALAMTAGGLIWGVVSAVAGQVLLGVVVFAWSAYVAPGWWASLQRPAPGLEMLRLDVAGVTVHQPRRGNSVAWSVGWPQVRGFRVHEVGVPEPLQDHLGLVTKVLTIEVLDHREVQGPSDHRGSCSRGRS